LEPVQLSPDGRTFVLHPSGAAFTPWGFNYDHDDAGRLLEDYWIDEWATVAEDFGEMRGLGANVVRIHLQFAKFMESPDRANAQALAQLRKLLSLADESGLRLDLTGLGCYHKKDVPAWYDALDEESRWRAQEKFWEAVAATCAPSSAVFCYDLMNEPILPAEKPETDWLAADFAGKHFVQRITLDLRGRTREQVARAWIDRLVAAVRRHDARRLITVGVIPWVHVFGGGRPDINAPEVGGALDFVSVHFYPKKGKVEQALKALAAYDVGKPVVIEECFPLECSFEEYEEFVRRSSPPACGWIGFYWGKTIAELRATGTLKDAIVAGALERFRKGPPQR
jgi:hypothetical protein